MPATPSPTTTPPPTEWDAVRVPRQLGLAAMAILGARSGAVVEHGQAVYYFLSAGTAATWDTQNAQPLPASETAPIPPTRRTNGPGSCWRICPGEDGWVTDPGALYAALADALVRTGAAA